MLKWKCKVFKNKTDVHGIGILILQITKVNSFKKRQDDKENNGWSTYTGQQCIKQSRNNINDNILKF